MKLNTIRAGLLTGLLALSTIGVIAQQEDQGHGMSGMHMPMMESGDPLAELQGEEFDVAFLSMMIAHHEGAIEMAEWLIERTGDPELRAAAEAIVAAQGTEIEQMTRWLEEWYGRDLDETMAGMMRSEMDAMMGQMQAEADPDRSFLEMMSKHHMSAIDMAQLALTHTEQPELRALARDIIVAQAKEIYQYQEWLAKAEVQ